MKKHLLCLFALLVVFNLEVFAQVYGQDFVKSDSLHNLFGKEYLKGVDFGYYIVPEDWENPNEKVIRLAVAIIHNTSDLVDSNPILVLEGGPGSGAVEGLRFWLNHPLRENKDIVLVDTRGTGLSQPRLCPDLGGKFFEILAQNQNRSQDEEEKIKIAKECRDDLVRRGIKIQTYNSINVSYDFNLVRKGLGYNSWNLLAVSYGTYLAQVYRSIFPDDVETMILDSPISSMSEYYTHRTSNYMDALNVLFSECEKNKECNDAYPNLREVYFETLKELYNNPVTVKRESGDEFTYNAEDFKIAIHQALYHKPLIQLMPLLIYQFHNRNKETLNVLIEAFSGALRLDYGVYYCVSCNEALPQNPEKIRQKFNNKVSELNGLSFYDSDYGVCEQWNDDETEKIISNIALTQDSIPTLIFTGGFDPITPQSNGEELTRTLQRTFLINRSSFGHASSFTTEGGEVIQRFIENPTVYPGKDDLLYRDDIEFFANIELNHGVYRLGNSLIALNPMFLSPLIISVFVLLLILTVYCVQLIRKVKIGKHNLIMRLVLITCSILGITIIAGFVLALNSVASINYYILAFGLPDRFSYLFNLLFAFFILVVLSLLFFIVDFKHLKDRSIAFSVLFSNILIAYYFIEWGFFEFFL